MKNLKKKTILFLLINVILCYSSNAQVPNLDWVNTIGGTAQSIVVDNTGNIYLTGCFGDTVDFDPGIGVFNLVASPGVADVFIQKLDQNGNLIWAKSYGGGSNSQCSRALCIDDFGNVIIVGQFKGVSDLDPGVNVQSFTSNGLYDLFIQKIDSDGNLIWAKTIGGNQNDEGFGIDTDQFGNIYITGFYFETVDFDPNTGTSNLISQGQADAFILKLNSLGEFVWVKSIQGPDWVIGYDLKVDEFGNSYIVGRLTGTADLDPSTGVFELSSNGYSDVFILKLDSFGNYQWAISFGGIWEDYSKSIWLDDNVFYITGKFASQVDFDTGIGVFNLGSISDPHDAFVSKFDIDGNFIWAKEIGGTGIDSGNSICSDNFGNIYLAGEFNDSIDLNPGAGTSLHISSGGGDAFALKLDPNGEFVWGESLGSAAVFPDWGSEIYADDFGGVYVLGHYSGLTDFDPSSDIFNLDISGGLGNDFIQKLNGIVGLNEIYSKSDVFIFPNPANESFVISQTGVEELQVELYDSRGILVLKRIISGEQTIIKTNTIADGLYILITYTSTGAVSTNKIVLKQ